MLIGMLWFDNDPTKTLLQKIHRAVDYYVKKYHSKPNMVFANENDIPNDFEELDGLQVKPSKRVLKNHLWIGVDLDSGKA